MTEKQLQIIISLLSANQFAIVHLSNVIAHHAQVSPEDIAASFEKSGEHISRDLPNRELILMVCRQIAAGIRSSSAGPEYEALLSRLLH